MKGRAAFQHGILTSRPGVPQDSSSPDQSTSVKDEAHLLSKSTSRVYSSKTTFSSTEPKRMAL